MTTATLNLKDGTTRKLYSKDTTSFVGPGRIGLKRRVLSNFSGKFHSVALHDENKVEIGHFDEKELRKHLKDQYEIVIKNESKSH